MNGFAPRALRVSFLNTRTALRSCTDVDSLAARLARSLIRPYHVPSSSFQKARIRSESKILSGFRQRESNVFDLPAGIRTFASQRIITRFEDLPPNFDSEDGLPFRVKQLSEPEAVAVFGGLIKAHAANQLLRLIHGRRVAGTLEDPSLPNPYEQQVFEAGLAWLRKNVPVDEVECAGLRARLELEELEGGTLARAEKMGLYKANSKPRKDVYGKSGLDAIREAKEQELDKRDAQEEARLNNPGGMNTGTGTLERLGARSQVELRRPGENPWLKHYIERSQILPETPPEMSKFQRLWPSGLVVLIVIGGCVLFASVYTPPRKEWRLWPDVPPSAATILGIIFTNAIILGAWRFPPMFRVLNKYFITVPGYPFSLSLVGNIFSHHQLYHFSLNMAVLWFVGTRLHEEVGRGNFLAIYFGCGTFASFASLSSWVLRNNFTTSSLGASGAIAGVIAAYLFYNSSEYVKIFGFPPDNWPQLSAIVLLSLLVATELLSMRRNGNLTLDHWAHLGGYASGVAAAEILKRRSWQEKATEIEKGKNTRLMDWKKAAGKP